MLALLLALLQTTPGNISKVPRDSDLCNFSHPAGDTVVGTYEIVVLVDAVRWDWSGGTGQRVPHRYQVIRTWAAPPTGPHIRTDTNVSDTGPICPPGTLHVGQRPHLATLKLPAPATYKVFGQMLDFRPDGLLTRIPDATDVLTVTVK